MQYIDRSKSVITGEANLEHLYTFKDFPVFLGCVDQPQEDDILADMSWSICPNSGMIQLDKVLPLEIVYQAQHNDGVGQTWLEYYRSFAEYIKTKNVSTILEIGGGKGKLAEEFVSIEPKADWTILEPNPDLIPKNKQISIVKGFFDENFKFDKSVDAVVHSQVFEHAYDPLGFLSDISKFLDIGGKMIFAFPDLKWFLEHKYTNAINFEHTTFVTDYFTDYLLRKAGFRIIDKTSYKNYDFFYTVEKIASVDESVVLESQYVEYKQIFVDFVDYHQDLARKLNSKMDAFEGEVYLFGAHIFSQYLIGFGLKTDKILNILDNSEIKRNKRLYGTPLTVLSPYAIVGKKNVAVVLKAAIYQEEIRKQLVELNPNVVIFE